MSQFRIIFVVFLFLILGPRPARGQTISPVIAEYRGAQAEGAFQIRNETLSPFTVILRPMSFSVNRDGRAVYRALDPDISLQLSTNSFRLLPRRRFTVYYRVRTAHVPVWFTIYAAIVPQTKAGRMNLVIELPHTVYLLNKKPLSGNNVVCQSAELDRATGQVSAVVENSSTKFGRVNRIEIFSKSAKQVYAGFPLFPGQRRVIHLRWKKKGRPRKIQLKFSHFQVDRAVLVHRASP